MKLFKENITPRLSTLGDKIYPLVVDIKKGVKSGDAINFVTADNEVGILSIELVNGDEPYDISGCIVCGTIQRPDTSTLNVYCDIVGANKLEIPLGVSGTYQEGVHNFDLKIYRGNEKVIGVPTMSYTVTGSLSSDGVVEGDDRLPVLTTVLDNAQDKLTRLDKAIAGATNDLEVKEARDGEVTLNARLERDLEKGKIHFIDVEGSNISTESEEGYLENVEIHGNTWQDANNLSDIRSVGTKVEGQELYEIPVLSYGKNLLHADKLILDSKNTYGYFHLGDASNYVVSIKDKDTSVNIQGLYFGLSRNGANSTGGVLWSVGNGNIKSTKITHPDYKYFSIHPNTKEAFEKLNQRFYVQIEEGTQATSYEPYQEDKLTILSPTPLERVGDVADRIICKDGVWGVEKNVKKLVLNGKENGWKATTRYDSETLRFYECKLTDSRIIKPICNKYISKGITPTANEECIFIDIGWDSLCFKVSKEKYPTLNSFTESLANLDTVVYYSTTQPTFIPLPHSQQIKLRTFADRTNISFLTEIEGTVKASVPKSLGATVNSHTSQIDNLNKELDRVKKLEESTVTTVTSYKAFTTIAETTGGYFEDVKLEGKTLVNLVSSEYNNITYNGRTSNHHFYDTIYNGGAYKTNTTYTYIVNVTQNTFNSVSAQWGNTYATHDETIWTSFKEVQFPTSGQVKFTLNTKTEFTSGLKENRCYIKSNKEQGKTLVFNYMILEGDWTDKEIPSYFEGLKSVGQDTDEIEILSTTSNLLDLSLIDGLVEEEGKIVAKRIVRDSNSSLKLNPNTRYKITIEKYDSNIAWIGFGYKANGTFTLIGNTGNQNNKVFEFTTPNEKDIIFYAGANNTNDIGHYLRLIKLEHANSSSDSSIAKHDKKQILYYNPTTQTWEKPVLREWDSIEKHSDGKYYYHKRSGEIVLNGNENWVDSEIVGSTKRFSFTVNGVKTNSQSICDKLPTTQKTEAFDNIRCSTNLVWYHSIDTNSNVEDVKNKFSNNPTTVVYELAKEEVYECANLDLITYSGETNLIVSSGAIQPKITLKVLSNVSNVVKLLQEKVSVLENKFIQGLKQVLSGDMMSLAHLLYPEDFENNHEIQTLEL